MAFTPQSVTDALHKVSSVFAVLALVAGMVPALAPWQQLLVTLTGALGGAGIVGSATTQKS